LDLPYFIQAKQGQIQYILDLAGVVISVKSLSHDAGYQPKSTLTLA
jgi:hypothetical protein